MGMKIREVFTKADNATLCEIRVLGVLGTVAVILVEIFDRFFLMDLIIIAVLVDSGVTA
jgi:hypothetical protein